MAKNSAYEHAYNGAGYGVWTAPFGTAGPVNLATPVPNFYEVGTLDDSGIQEAHSLNDNFVYDMAGTLQRDIRNQEQRSFQFSAMERNAVVCGLLAPGSTVATTSTAEVQTVTITGSPTGGTFTLTLPGVGTLTGIANNVPTATLATNLSAAFGMTIAVSGTAGTSYVVTFPAAAGNVAQMTTTSAFTPSGSSSVATTTPGVTGVNTRPVGAGTGLNRRAFVVDTVDGTMIQRFVINNGEAVQSGNVTYTGSGLAVYQFTLNVYLDSSQVYYTILDNDTAMGGAYL